MALGPCKHPPLPNKPGSNWVEKQGGLPHFIDCVARAIYWTGGGNGDVSAAVRKAIGRVEDWAQGRGGVKPGTVAQARAAVTELHAKGAKSKAETAAKNLSEDCGCDSIDLAFHPDQKRGFHGRWIRQLADKHGVTLSDAQHEQIARHSRQHGGVDRMIGNSMTLGRKGVVVRYRNGEVHAYGKQGKHVRLGHQTPTAPKRINSRAMNLTEQVQAVDLAVRGLET